MIIANQKPIAIIGPAASSMTHEFQDELSRSHATLVIEPEFFLQSQHRNQYQYILACWPNFLQRKQIAMELDHEHLDLVTVIHDTTLIGHNPAPEIEPGCFVFGFSRICLGSRIGRHSIIGPYSLVGHYSELGTGCILRPGVMITDKSQVGDHCVMNLRSTVTNKVRIADDVTVMAFSAVTKDIKDSGRYAGIPARRVHAGQDTG